MTTQHSGGLWRRLHPNEPIPAPRQEPAASPPPPAPPQPTWLKNLQAKELGRWRA